MPVLVKSWDPEKNRFVVEYHGEEYYLHVHGATTCLGEHCVAHNPSDHSMRDFPLVYRSDKNLFERVCPHGVGHPDPDSVEFFELMGDTTMAVHGCDGCCAPVESVS